MAITIVTAVAAIFAAAYIVSRFHWLLIPRAARNTRAVPLRAVISALTSGDVSLLLRHVRPVLRVKSFRQELKGLVVQKAAAPAIQAVGDEAAADMPATVCILPPFPLSLMLRPVLLISDKDALATVLSLSDSASELIGHQAALAGEFDRQFLAHWRAAGSGALDDAVHFFASALLICAGLALPNRQNVKNETSGASKAKLQIRAARKVLAVLSNWGGWREAAGKSIGYDAEAWAACNYLSNVVAPVAVAVLADASASTTSKCDTARSKLRTVTAGTVARGMTKFHFPNVVVWEEGDGVDKAVVLPQILTSSDIPAQLLAYVGAIVRVLSSSFVTEIEESSWVDELLDKSSSLDSLRRRELLRTLRPGEGSLLTLLSGVRKPVGGKLCLWFKRRD